MAGQNPKDLRATGFFGGVIELAKEPLAQDFVRTFFNREPKLGLAQLTFDRAWQEMEKVPEFDDDGDGCARLRSPKERGRCYTDSVLELGALALGLVDQIGEEGFRARVIQWIWETFLVEPESPIKNFLEFRIWILRDPRVRTPFVAFSLFSRQDPDGWKSLLNLVDVPLKNSNLKNSWLAAIKKSFRGNTQWKKSVELQRERLRRVSQDPAWNEILWREPLLELLKGLKERFTIGSGFFLEVKKRLCGASSRKVSIWNRRLLLKRPESFCPDAPRFGAKG